jgi:hypothetical protein
MPEQSSPANTMSADRKERRKGIKAGRRSIFWDSLTIIKSALSNLPAAMRKEDLLGTNIAYNMVKKR